MNKRLALRIVSIMTSAFCALSTAQLLPLRDHVLAVGSSTAYPFATAVAERVSRSTDFPSPQIEPTGSGGGIQLFCQGIGPEYPDIVFSSREIKPSEITNCQTNDVKDLLELPIGYDGIIIAGAKTGPSLSLTPKDIYLALGRTVPAPEEHDRLVTNPYKRWNEINPTLPDMPIRVYGPPPTSGTRDVFVALAMGPGCRSFSKLSALRTSDAETFKEICFALREDGAYVEAGENDNVIVQKLQVDDKAVGIFGFNYYDQNPDKVQAAAINGTEPSWESIFDHVYPLSRPLYLYVKREHIEWIPGLKAFLMELTDERAWGEDGYLGDKGLVPLPEKERKLYADKARALK